MYQKSSTTHCLIYGQLPTTVQYFTITELWNITLPHEKSKTGQRHRNYPSTSISSWQKHEFPTIIDKPPVEKQKEVALFPDFGELTIDSLIDTGALTGAISEADLRKIRLLAPQATFDEGLPPDFQSMVPSGRSKTPSATTELQFEVGVILFKQGFIVKTNLTNPIFVRLRETMRQGVLDFHFFHASQACRQHVLKH